MNSDQMDGTWTQMKAALAKKWAKLTDDDFAAAKGDRALLAGRLQERYGIEQEQADRELDSFYKSNSSEHQGTREVATEGGPLSMDTLKIGMKP